MLQELLRQNLWKRYWKLCSNVSWALMAFISKAMMVPFRLRDSLKPQRKRIESDSKFSCKGCKNCPIWWPSQNKANCFPNYSELLLDKSKVTKEKKCHGFIRICSQCFSSCESQGCGNKTMTCTSIDGVYSWIVDHSLGKGGDSRAHRVDLKCCTRCCKA